MFHIGGLCASFWHSPGLSSLGPVTSYAGLRRKEVMLRMHLRSLLLLGSLIFAAACQKSPSSRASEPAPGLVTVKETAAPPAEVAYSPFVINVKNQSLPFRQISFKQVSSGERAMDGALFETLAEAVALELSQQQKPISSELSYSPAAADPQNHLACGAAHIYVDFWQSDAPARWGFSLWSGCEEESQFAWEEIASPRKKALIDEIKPLSSQIASKINKATQTGCFRKTC